MRDQDYSHLFSVPRAEPGAAAVLESASEHLKQLPAEAQIVLLALVVAGVMLWLFGGRFIKPAFASLGLVLGSATGLLIAAAIGDDNIGQWPALHVGLLAGGVIGLTISIVAFKIAMIGAAAGAFAAAGFLLSLIIVQHRPVVEADAELLAVQMQEAGYSEDEYAEVLGILGSPGMSDNGDEDRAAARQRLVESIDEAVTGAAGVVNESAEQIRGFASALYHDLKGFHDRLDRDGAMIVGACAFGGALAGMLIGLFRPGKSAAMITAMAGSAIVLFAGIWLVSAWELPFEGVLTREPIAWANIWLVMSLGGWIFQLSRMLAKVQKPAGT